MPNSAPLRLSPARLLTFGAAALLLVGSGVASVWGLGEVERSFGRIDHSHAVLAGIEATRSSLRASESAARAYRLTNRPAQYSEYLASLPASTYHAAHVVRLTADNAAQQLRARELQRLASERLSEIDVLVRMQNDIGLDEALEATRRGRGIALMHLLDQHADTMAQTERELLSQRESLMASRGLQLKLFIVGSLVLSILLLLALLSGLLSEARRARKLERDARLAMTELEKTLIDRDRLSEQRRSLSTYASMLQSSQNMDEILALTANVIGEMLPQAGGRCYVLRASQNLAEGGPIFGQPGIDSDELLQPAQCWALRRGQPHQTEPGHSTLRCEHLHPGDDAAPHAWTICLPLVAQGSSLGLLHVSGRIGLGKHGVFEQQVLESVAEQLSLAMANLQLRETLRVQSLRDALTGLYNRRYLEENLSREVQRCARRSLPLTVMMIDVDHFKRFNDTHGHGAGDALLTRVGEVLGQMTRGEDIACRYGGEEFTLVLPEASYEIGLRRAEEIRETLQQTSVVHLRQQLPPITVSIGVASFPEDGDTPERLLATADSALYVAKNAGRNRVVGRH